MTKQIIRRIFLATLLIAAILGFSLAGFAQTSTIVPGKNGGTGVANTGKTITLGSTFNYPSDAFGFLKNNGSGSLMWDAGTGTFVPLSGTLNASPVTGMIEHRAATGGTFVTDSVVNRTFYMGVGNRKDLSLATNYARIEYNNGNLGKSITLNSTKSDGSYGKIFTNYNDVIISAYNATNLTYVDLSGTILQTVSDYTAFAGDVYDPTTAGYVASNYTSYTKPHIGLLNTLFAPISVAGSVTSFSYTNGNGFTGTVTNPATVPTLSLSLQNATTSQSGQLTLTDWNIFNGKESALTFSTGLTRSTNTVTNNLSTGISGGQTLIGGTGTADALTIKSTSGAGTAGADIIFHNGTSEMARMLSGTSSLSTYTVTYLIVGGGGAGGGLTGNAGGGAGGMLTSTTSLSVNSYAIVVGAGGVGANNISAISNNGASSSFNGITATGGGGGGTRGTQPGQNGGSGGGGASSAGSSNVAGTGISGQGLAGGTGVDGTGGNGYRGNGGGGAGQIGGTNAYGQGGNGLQSSISGVSTYYAGGGGGGANAAAPGTGAGGLGGGGGGVSSNSSIAGGNGTANTGGGGGGAAGGGAAVGGSGGSGVVIISYTTGDLVASGGTITTSGGNTIHTFTSNGTFIITSIVSIPSCIGIGVSNPLAALHIKANAAKIGNGQLLFTNGGALLSTPVAGMMETTTDNIYWTIGTGTARKHITLDEGLTSGRVPYVTTNGRLTDNSAFTYDGTRLSPNYITLAAGTASAGTAPLKFTAGTNLTTAEAGAIEYDGTNIFSTPNTTIGRFPIANNSVQYTTPVTTATVTATQQVSQLVCNPAGTLAALTIVFPPNPVNGQVFGIAISQIITVITLQSGTGAATINGTITTAGTNSAANFVYCSTPNAWFQSQ